MRRPRPCRTYASGKTGVEANMSGNIRRGALAAAIGLLAVTMIGEAQVGQREWPAYAGDKASTKYSPLDQINKDNVKNLRIVWRQSATPMEMRKPGTAAPVPVNYPHTPLMVGGLLYISTGLGTVAALDPTTGKVAWFDAPLEGEPSAV